jgi:hypothetical protein
MKNEKCKTGEKKAFVSCRARRARREEPKIKTCKAFDFHIKDVVPTL